MTNRKNISVIGGYGRSTSANTCGRFSASAIPGNNGRLEDSTITAMLNQKVGYDTKVSSVFVVFKANSTDRAGNSLPSRARVWTKKDDSGVLVERSMRNTLYLSVPDGDYWKRVAVFVLSSGTSPDLTQLKFDFYKNKTVVSLPSVSNFAKRIFAINETTLKATSKVYGNEFGAVSEGKFGINGEGYSIKHAFGSAAGPHSHKHSFATTRLSLGIAADCTEKWVCGNWGRCSSKGLKTRTCQDANGCGTTILKPLNIFECSSQ